jgi:SecD/SecF fusion protein
MKHIGGSAAAFVAGLALLAVATGPLPAQKQEEDKDKGGKVLTFEVEKQPDRAPVDAKTLAEMLKKRIDPNDLYKIIIRPADGEGRVEIVLPAGPAGKKDLTAAEVERIKALVSRVGALEFAIVANGVDDAAAIAEARKLINEETTVQALAALAEKGLPPPVVRDAKTALPKTYTVKLAGGQQSVVAYRWVELGPSERKSLALDNAAQDDPKRNHAWQQAAKARGKATTLTYPGGDLPLMRGALFLSRVCVDKSLPGEERKAKAVEYFVLVREPEIDPQTGKATPKLDGSYITEVKAAKTLDDRPAVGFTFNPKGAELVGKLSGKNVPEGNEEDQHRRHLAIILDGLVMSAPTLNSKLGNRGQISGNFTQAEIDRLVEILRHGALPAKLRPVNPDKQEKPGK